jgi:hypothetical protein
MFLFTIIIYLLIKRKKAPRYHNERPTWAHCLKKAIKTLYWFTSKFSTNKNGSNNTYKIILI